MVAPAGAVINSVTFSATKDAMLKQDNQDLNHGVKNELEIKSQDPKKNTGRNSRAVVGFDISTIPPGATIELAEFRAFLKKKPSSTRNYNVYRLQNTWLEGSSAGVKNSAAINGVTWIERQFGDNLWTGSGPGDWIAIGGDYLGTPTAVLATPAASGWMVWNVIGDVDAWYGGGVPNFGWLIRDETENQKPKKSGMLHSRENGDPALSPSLVVTYLKTGAAVSTGTVPVGYYSPLRVTFTNAGGPGADQVNQVSFNIPAGWSQVPTIALGYAITAPGGKTWSVTAVPPASDGPQTVTIMAATAGDDLAAGESLDIMFSVRAPWDTGATNWTFSTLGAAGGTHLPVDWSVLTTTGTLEFQPGSNQTMNALSLSGSDTSASGTLGALLVRDSRGTSGGWSVTVAATDFVLTTDPTQMISASGLSVPAAPAVTVVSGSSPPTAFAGSLAGAGLQLLSAAAGTGAGEYQLAPALELIVPAETISGTYSATITETIMSGL